jgi:cytochrome c2
MARGALILVCSLLAVGFTGGAASLAVQRWQTQQSAAASAHELTGGDVERGKAAFSAHGCGACHSVRNVVTAQGQVGPALDGVAARAFLAGGQPNAPDRMVAWIHHPQALQPGAGMPDSGLTDAEARDVAAYLYTLR